MMMLKLLLYNEIVYIFSHGTVKQILSVQHGAVVEYFDYKSHIGKLRTWKKQSGKDSLRRKDEENWKLFGESIRVIDLIKNSLH